MSPQENRDAMIKLYVERALSTLGDAKILANAESWDSCINRLYYSCFYIVYALIAQNLDVRTKTHSGIKALFNEHFVKQGSVNKQISQFYSLLMEKRNKSDYEDFGTFTAEEVLPLISQTEEFIKTIQKLIV